MVGLCAVSLPWLLLRLPALCFIENLTAVFARGLSVGGWRPRPESTWIISNNSTVSSSWPALALSGILCRQGYCQEEGGGRQIFARLHGSPTVTTRGERWRGSMRSNATNRNNYSRGRRQHVERRNGDEGGAYSRTVRAEGKSDWRQSMAFQYFTAVVNKERIYIWPLALTRPSVHFVHYRRTGQAGLNPYCPRHEIVIMTVVLPNSPKLVGG